MRVGTHIGVQNKHFNASMVNKSFTEDPKVKVNQKTGKRDVVELSPMAKSKQLLTSLFEQKQNLIERKNNLIDTTLKNGGKMEDLKASLEVFEERLSNIEQQIAQTMAEQAKAMVEKKDEEPVVKEPKTEEEIQQGRLNDVVKLSGDVDRAKVISSSKDKVEGKIKVIKSEMKLDRYHAEPSPFVEDGGAARAAFTTSNRIVASKKEAAVLKLKLQSDDLSAQIGKEINDRQDKVVESRIDPEVKTEELE